ncbi:MAG: hypothetical protein JWO42_1696, partial [Chloroflexi bacterium]|nr:hypothetical protein [Chloroflexota bacterium]
KLYDHAHQFQVFRKGVGEHEHHSAGMDQTGAIYRGMRSEGSAHGNAADQDLLRRGQVVRQLLGRRH